MATGAGIETDRAARIGALARLRVPLALLLVAAILFDAALGTGNLLAGGAWGLPVLTALWLLLRGETLENRAADLTLAITLILLAGWMASGWGPAREQALATMLASALAGVALAAGRLRGPVAAAAVGALAVSLLLLALLSAKLAWFSGAGQSLTMPWPGILASLVLAAWLPAAAFSYRPPRPAHLCALAVSGLALLVLVGWSMAVPDIVQGGTVYVPMQFNTASSLLLSGIALLILLGGKRGLALLPLLPVGLFAVVSLLEEYAGIGTRSGEWLFVHPIVAEGVVPGRMAPNTATALLLAALGVILAPPRGVDGPGRWTATWAIGFMVSSIGLVVLLGYASDVPAIRAWGSHTPMALMTAVGLSLLGLGLGFAGSPGRRAFDTRGVWIPLAVAMTAVVGSVLVWYAIDRDDPQLSGLLLFAGLATGGMLAMSLRLAALARRRAEQAEQARQELQAQVSQSERTRAALGDVERELGSVFESISDAFYTLDADWRFVLVNPRAAQMMQVPREQLLGRTVWEVFPAAVGTLIEESFRLAASERRTIEFEIYFAPMAGWFSARVFPHPSGIAVYFLDVSARKRAETGMRKAQATAERAQRMAQLGSWEYDLRTGELAWSEETCRIFGLSPGQLSRGLPALLERVHLDDRKLLVDAQRRLHAGEGDIDIEYRVMLPGGETRVVRELGTLSRDEHGEPAFAAGAIQDITDRHHAEDALRELAHRLEESQVVNRLVMDSSLDVICSTDANGRFTQVSAASLRVWGYPAHELVGRAYTELLHPDDRGQSHRQYADVMTGHSTLDFRNRLIAKDGRIVHMQWSAVWSPRDRLMFAVGRDSTEAEMQERALVDARDSLQRALHVARMGPWEFDIGSRTLAWSEEARAIFQLSQDQLGGTFEEFSARVHPEDAPALEYATALAISGEAELDIEHRIVLPGGHIGHVHQRARLIRDETGRPWLLVGTVQDITDRHRQAQQLRDSEQRMRTTVESAFDSIITMAPDGRIIEFNAAAERMFGFRRDDVIGRMLADTIIPAAQREAHAAGLKRHLETGTAKMLGRRLEMTALRANGSEILVELTIAQISSGGEQAYTGFIRDITDVKRAQLLEAGQRAILAGIAARRPLPETLAGITRLFELQYPAAMSTVLLLDAAGERVLTGAAPSLPPAFTRAIHGLPIGPNAGSCGTAAWRGERVVVTDIASDPLWEDHAELAKEHGLRACWSTPVKSIEGKVLATFATYYREPRAPEAGELTLMDGMAMLAAMAIEQESAYRELNLSEQRFRSLFEEHPDAVYSMDLEGRYTAYNGRLRGEGMAPPEEVLGRMFDENVVPEQKDAVRAHFRAASRGEARNYETTAITRSGQRFEMRVTNLPIMVDGQVTGVFGIAQDITLLRKHQRELSAALDAAQDASLQLRRLSNAAILLNRDIGESEMYPLLAEHLREILGANQSLVSVDSGQGSAGQVYALSLAEQYVGSHEFDPAVLGEGIYAEVRETNQPMRLTSAELASQPGWRGRGKPAEAFPPLRGWLAVPLVASDGRNMGLLQLGDKLSGEFTADDELVAVQFAQMASIAIERARLIERLGVRDRFFDLSLEVFVIYDPGEARFQQVNPMLARIAGYSQEELCSRPLLDFLHPDDRAAAQARTASLVAVEEVSKVFHNRYVRPDGGVRWMEWVSVPGPDGLVYGVGRDVTERRHAEAVLRQTLADLNNRNRELQDFAFIASHDLQEPLRKIRSFSDRLQQRHADQLDPEARDYLDRTGQAAARMQTLIDDLLAYSRVAARAKASAPTDLGVLMAAVVDDLEARIESSGGAVHVGPMPVLEGDATQLRQMFQNVLANALKFRSPERSPVVSVSAETGAIDGQPGWEICVQDNGIGFDPKYAERIFGPFQRLHGRQDYEGTGIGLAIVRRIVERHHGRIIAVGRVGEGASLTIFLPARQPSDPQPDTRRAPLDGGQPREE